MIPVWEEANWTSMVSLKILTELFVNSVFHCVHECHWTYEGVSISGLFLRYWIFCPFCKSEFELCL